MTTLALAMMLQSQARPVSLPPELEACIKHYHDALTCKGTIKLTVTAPTGSASVTTQFALERPAKLMILQEGSGGEKRAVTSDGKFITYDNPSEHATQARLMESVSTRTKMLSVEDQYKATVDSLIDRSVPLDFIVGHPEDVKYVHNQFATLTPIQPSPGATKAFGGEFRPYLTALSTGTYRIDLDDKGNIIDFARRQSVALKNGQQISLEMVWKVDVATDLKFDKDFFKVLK